MQINYSRNIATHNMQDLTLHDFVSQKDILLTNFAKEADTNIMGMY